MIYAFGKTKCMLGVGDIAKQWIASNITLTACGKLVYTLRISFDSASFCRNHNHPPLSLEYDLNPDSATNQ